MSSYAPVDRVGLARSLGVALMLAAPGILVVGNHLVGELPGRQTTPFEVAGPGFLLAVLPAYVLLAWRGRWLIALAAVLAFHAVFVGLTHRFN